MRLRVPSFIVSSFLLSVTACAQIPGPPAPAPFATARASEPYAVEVDLPFRVLRLENGLTAVMHPDTTYPAVAVELWTRGGARHEEPGQYGVGHLFEHLMPGSPRIASNPENQAAFREVSRGGNARTHLDFVQYYRQVAPHGLELALAVTAERLDSDPEMITAEDLERQKQIVLRELERMTNTPYDPEMWMRFHRGTFGDTHPYGHPIGGTRENVEAASLALLRDWHRRHVGARNALVLISGNFDPDAAEQFVRKHFASIRPGEALAHVETWVPPAPNRHEVMEAGLPYGTVYLKWPVPPWGSAAGDHLTLLGTILKERLAQHAQGEGASPDSVFGEAELWESAGMFTLGGTFRDPAASDSVEAILRTELEQILREGPTPSELERAKAQIRSEFVRGLEQPAWMGGRTEVLGRGMLYQNDPGYYRVRLERMAAATPEEVRQAGQQWLSAQGYALHILPRASYAAGGKIDRTSTIPLTKAVPPSFPAVRDAVLENGLRVLTAHRPGLPLVQLAFAVRAGWVSDAPATAGRARLVLGALKRVPVTPDSMPLTDALAALGADLTTEVDPEFARLSMSVLSDQVEAATSLVAEAMASGLPNGVIGEAKDAALARLERVLDDPEALRTRALACALAGPDPCNPSARDGLGTRESLERLSPEEVRSFFERHYHPSNTVVAIAGDAPQARMLPLVERPIGQIRAREPPPRTRATPAAPFRRGVVIVDRPGAMQSQILFAQAMPIQSVDELIPARILLISLQRRVASNLRQEKQWTYDVWPFSLEAQPGSALMRLHVPVPVEKTVAAMEEILGEAHRLKVEPIGADLLTVRQRNLTSEVMGSVTSRALLANRLLDLVRLDLPPDYYAQYLQHVSTLTPKAATAGMQSLLRPDDLAWVIVGDARTIEPELRDLGIADVRVITAEDLH